MPPVLPSSALPRLIVYQQTHHTSNGTPVSILPLIENDTGITHIYIAAIHLNQNPGHITLNDNTPDDPKFNILWSEVKTLQKRGVKVMGMLGGAAKGSYALLERDFDAYYPPLRDMVEKYSLDGLDLDIEENVSLGLTQKLLRAMKQDFGESFICTLAPVFPALVPAHQYLMSLTRRLLTGHVVDAPAIIRAFLKPGVLFSQPHLSGFSYFDLEASPEGKLVDWYNVQFYCGWGDASNARGYELAVQSGWDPRKLVLGVITSPGHGRGFVHVAGLGSTIQGLKQLYGDRFGGVMGWEYWGAGQDGDNWRWVKSMGNFLGRGGGAAHLVEGSSSSQPLATSEPVPPPENPEELAKAMRQAQEVAASSNISDSAPDRNATLQNAGLGASTSSTTVLPDRNATPTIQDANVQKLIDIGFEQPEAIAALEAMGGDVDAAARLLFGD